MSFRQITRSAAIFGVAAATLAAGAAGAQDMGPGMIGQIEGQAALDGKPLMPGSEGRMAVRAGQMLSTGNGRAQVVLTPGVVLRLDRASAVKVITADVGHSEVLLESGRAHFVVGNLSGSPDLEVDAANGVQTALLERGVYEFDAKAGELKVLDGKAAVSQNENSKWVDVKAGHEIALNGSASKATEFDDRGGYGEGYGDRPGYGGYGLGEGYSFGGYGYGAEFGGYGPFAYGFYPGFYGGFYPGFYGSYGFGYGGFGYGGFRGGFGGFRGGRR